MKSSQSSFVLQKKSMAARQIVSLAFVAAICSLAYGDKICYNCGHRTLPDGTTEALPDTALCGDFANSDDITTTCGDGDDCCASVEAYFTTVDEKTGENSTVIIGRHGCESDLSHIGEQGVLCSENTDSCINIDHSSLPNINDENVTITDMEICFCSGNRCNSEDPIPPEPTKEPTKPTQKGKQCYSCGYRKLPNGETEALPELAECSDFATPEDITVNCANGDDCCASMKSYFTTEDETTGEKSTVTIGRHGCESDLSHIGEQGVICSEHTDACVNIDHSSLPNENDNNVTITDMEICFCSGDRCNAEDPIPPEPTTGSGANLVSSLAVLILAFFF